MEDERAPAEPRTRGRSRTATEGGARLLALEDLDLRLDVEHSARDVIDHLAQAKILPAAREHEVKRRAVHRAYLEPDHIGLTRHVPPHAGLGAEPVVLLSHAEALLVGEPHASREEVDDAHAQRRKCQR